MDIKDSSTSVNQDANSGNNDDDASELCPGFKDVDVFVKVSEQTKQILLILICLYVHANSQVGNVLWAVSRVKSWTFVGWNK